MNTETKNQQDLLPDSLTLIKRQKGDKLLKFQ